MYHAKYINAYKIRKISLCRRYLGIKYNNFDKNRKFWAAARGKNEEIIIFNSNFEVSTDDRN